MPRDSDEYDPDDSDAGQNSRPPPRNATGQALYKLTGEEQHQLGRDESGFRHTSQMIRNGLDGQHWRRLTSTELGLVHAYLAQQGQGLNPGRFQPLFQLCANRQQQRYENEREQRPRVLAQQFTTRLQTFERGLAAAQRPVNTLDSKTIQRSLAAYLVNGGLAAHHHEAVSPPQWDAAHNAAHASLKPHIRALQASWPTYTSASS